MTFAEKLSALVDEHLGERPVFVWYDPGATLASAARASVPQGVRFLAYDGSYLALRAAFEEADPELNGQTVLYVGAAPRQPSWLRDLELFGTTTRLGLCEVALAYGLALTSPQLSVLGGPLGRVLTVRWDELLPPAPSGLDLKMALIAAALDLGARPGLRDIVISFVMREDAPELLRRRGLHDELRQILETEGRLVNLPEEDVPQRRVAAALLLSEAAVDGALSTQQLEEVLPAPAARPGWAAWARDWIGMADDAAFLRWSEDIERLYRVRDRLTGPTASLAAVQGFASVDTVCLEQVAELVRSGEVGQAQDVVAARRASRWTRRAEATHQPLPWDSLDAALSLRQAAEEAIEVIESRANWEFAALLEAYVEDWWRLDDRYRRVEAHWSTLSGSLTDQAALPAARAYATFLDRLAAATADAIAAGQQWDAPGWSTPREVAARHLNESERVAVVLADALRVDLARIVVARLSERAIEVESERALVELPSVTQVGMAAIQAPGWEHRELALAGNSVFPKVGGALLDSRQDRLAALRQRYPRAACAELDAVNEGQTLPRGTPLVVYAQAIDEQGDHLPDVRVDLFELLAKRLADGVVRLLQNGCQKVLVIADHGFVLSPREPPVPTVPAPAGGSGTVRKHRYAVGRPSEVDGVLRLPLRTVGWDNDGSIVFPRGRGVFALSGEVPRFFHGGFLPQEVATLALVCRGPALPSTPANVRIVEPHHIETTIPRFVLQGESDTLLSQRRRARVVVRVDGRVVAESEPVEIGAGETVEVPVRLERYGSLAEVLVEDVETREVIFSEVLPVELPAGYEQLDL